MATLREWFRAVEAFRVAAVTGRANTHDLHRLQARAEAARVRHDRAAAEDDDSPG